MLHYVQQLLRLFDTTILCNSKIKLLHMLLFCKEALELLQLKTRLERMDRRLAVTKTPTPSDKASSAPSEAVDIKPSRYFGYVNII